MILECDLSRAVMEDFSIRTGCAVDDLVFSDIDTLFQDVVGIVEREVDRANRITDRIGE